MVFDEEVYAQAVEHKQFSLAFQPIVSLVSDRIIGGEALIRWQHPGWGEIKPARLDPFPPQFQFPHKKVKSPLDLW